MTERRQFIGYDTSAECNQFTGYVREISINNETKSIRVHDGVTAGGFETARNDMSNISKSTIDSKIAPSLAEQVPPLVHQEVDSDIGDLQSRVGANETSIAELKSTTEELDKTKADNATTLAGYHIDDAYTKDAVDSKLAVKANSATTLSGYGIGDAYTKTAVDGKLAQKADKANSLVGYGIADAYTKGETNSLLNNKADKATTLAGYGIGDAYTKAQVDSKIADVALSGIDDKLANCIVSAPNNIKLELVNGVLTLKAGSKVYYADGSSKILNIDTSVQYSAKQDDLIFFVGKNNNGIYITRIPYTSSGDTAPVVDNTRRIWYDTTNKMIKMYVPNESNYVEVSLPIAIGKSSGVNDAITSIDKVFNEFSAMGSTYFLLPNVKFLFSNGYDDLGGVKNIEWTSDKVYSRTRISNNGIQIWAVGYNQDTKVRAWNQYYCQDDEPSNPSSYSLWYKPSARKTYVKDQTMGNSDWNEYPAVLLCKDTEVKQAISNFNTRTPFVAVDSNDRLWASTASKPSGKYIDLTLGATGASYTAPANGTVYFAKLSGANTPVYLWIENIKSSLSNVAWINSNSSTDFTAVSLQVAAGDVFKVYYSAKGNTNYFRFIFDKGAI